MLLDKFTIQQKVLSTMLLCLVVSITVSFKLWFTFDRVFIVSGPVSGVLESILSSFLAIGLIISILLKILGKKNVVIDGLLVMAPILMVVIDYNRLQPWFYLYWSILCVVVLVKNEKKFTEYLLIVIALLYVYSGFHKINVQFFAITSPNFFKVSWIPQYVTSSVYFGKIVSVAEMLLGFGLMLRCTQKYCAILLLLMHILIVFILLPQSYTYVIIPLNIFLMVYLILILLNPVFVDFKAIFSNWFGKVLVVWLGFCPLLNIIDLWPSHMSYSLYSGVKTEYIILDENKGWYKHSYLESMKELKVPFNPSDYNAMYWFNSEHKSPKYQAIKIIKNRLTLTKDTVYYYPH